MDKGKHKRRDKYWQLYDLASLEEFKYVLEHARPVLMKERLGNIVQKKFEAARYSLASGIPCARHKCSRCCLETRMPLSNLDLKRILKLGYEVGYFAVKTKEEWCLKNNSGRCVFLLEEGCEIYPHRPEGCSLYPLVYDETSKKGVMDHFCPHSHEFMFQEKDVERLRNLIKRLAKPRIEKL